MNFIVIQGNVVGGRQIKDLGITVGYQEEVRLLQDRASWSKDLSEAIRIGEVIYKGAQTSVQPAQTPSFYPTRNPQPFKENVTVSRTSHSVTSPERNPLEEENKSLKKDIAKLISKMDELIEKGMAPVTEVRVVERNYEGNQSKEQYSGISVLEEEPVIYVPSTIRTESLKPSDEIKIEESSSQGSGLDAAAKALSTMKSKKPRRKKNEE